VNVHPKDRELFDRIDQVLADYDAHRRGEARDGDVVEETACCA